MAYIPTMKQEGTMKLSKIKGQTVTFFSTLQAAEQFAAASKSVGGSPYVDFFRGRPAVMTYAAADALGVRDYPTEG